MAIIAQYLLDGNANDSAGSNNGTATNVTWVDGKVNSAGSFNGSNSKIIIPYSSLTNFNPSQAGNNYTFNMWIKNNNISSSCIYLINRTFSNTRYNIYVDMNGGSIRAGVYNGSTFVLASTPVTQGEWFMFTFVVTGTLNFKLYINGDYKVEASLIGFNSTSTNEGFTIGNSAEGEVPFNGQIDEVEIHNTALTPTEIKQKYDLINRRIIAKYSLNGNANDSAGSNNGTPTNVTWVNGKVNGAGSFNGSNSKISIPNITFTATGSFTFNLFIKPNSSINYEAIVGFSNDYQLGGITLWKWTNNTPYVYIQDINNNTISLNPSINISDGNIRYISFTYENKYAKLYINGLLVSEGGNNSLVGNLFNTVDNQLGCKRFNSIGTYHQFYSGLIDEVEIHNTALTPAEIKNKYLFYNGFI